MAVLEKIRVKMGVFITVLIGIALISFIVDADTLRSVTSMFSSKYDVGSMAGKSITYQDYQKRIEYYNGINQMLLGNNALSESMQERVREQAWQEFVQEYVMEPQYDKCGIGVSNDEMESLVRGQYISPVIYNDPMFVDETGQFSRTAVLGFIQNINTDRSGMRKMYWQYVEKRVHSAQMVEKYLALVGQSQFTNDLQLKSAVDGKNTLSDISYVVMPLNAMGDTSIKVSEADLKAYYRKHEKSFEQETTRDIEYVAFPIIPSEQDVKLTEEDFYKAYEEFKTTKDLKQFIAFNSDRPYDDYFYKKGELPAKLDSFAFRATVSSVMPVDNEEYTYLSARIVEIKNLPDSVKARHILIPFQSLSKDAANKLADSLLTVLGKGANFAYLAQQYSADQAANRNEGDLGWFKQGDLRNVKAFEDTCFLVAKSKYFKVESPYGVHVAQVTERGAEEKKVKLAVLTKTAEPGKVTVQDLFIQANELASVSVNNYDKFVELSNEKGYIRVPAYNISEGDRTISIFENARELVRWIYEAKDHAVSGTLNLNNNSYFVVAAITEVREAGIAPFDQVRDDIEQLVRFEKQATANAQRMKELGAANIEAVADKLGLPIAKASGVSFGSSMVEGLGLEPKLAGAVAGAAENTLTGPVKGVRGVYMFSVDARETGAAYTKEDETLRTRMMYMQGRLFEFLPALEKAAKVEDWRFRYF